MVKLEKIVKDTIKNKNVRKVALGSALLASSYFVPELISTIADNIDQLPRFLPTYADHTLAGLATGLVAGSVGRKYKKEKLSIKNVVWKAAKFGGLFAAAYYTPAVIPLSTVINYVPNFIDTGNLLYSGVGLLTGLAGSAWKAPRNKHLKKTKSYISKKWQNVNKSISDKVKKVASVAAISLSLGNLMYHIAPIDIIPSFGQYNAKRYAPFSREARQLFRAAAKAEGLPESWGDSKGLHNILKRESNGYVGVPNYCIKNSSGRRARDDPSSWPKIHQELRNNTLPARRKHCGRRGGTSTASGLGQLLIGNVDRHYPNGRSGIGNPMSEARGMLNYIKSRYGHPDKAWAMYGRKHEGY